MDKKSYIETILEAFCVNTFSCVDKLIYRNHNYPNCPKWEALYIEMLPLNERSTGRSITLDVTDMTIPEIAKAAIRKITETMAEARK